MCVEYLQTAKQWWVAFVVLGVDATLGDECGIWEHLHSFREVKWGRGVSQKLNVLVFVYFKSRELRGWVSPRFPCVTPVMESFSLDLLQAIKSYWTESHLESCQTSAMELFCENSQRPKSFDNFRKNTPSQLFDWISNVPLIGKVL